MRSGWPAAKAAGAAAGVGLTGASGGRVGGAFIAVVVAGEGGGATGAGLGGATVGTIGAAGAAGLAGGAAAGLAAAAVAGASGGAAGSASGVAATLSRGTAGPLAATGAIGAAGRAATARVSPLGSALASAFFFVLGGWRWMPLAPPAASHASPRPARRAAAQKSGRVGTGPSESSTLRSTDTAGCGTMPHNGLSCRRKRRGDKQTRAETKGSVRITESRRGELGMPPRSINASAGARFAAS